jgi:hypothetical protein
MHPLKYQGLQCEKMSNILKRPFRLNANANIIISTTVDQSTLMSIVNDPKGLTQPLPVKTNKKFMNMHKTMNMHRQSLKITTLHVREEIGRYRNRERKDRRSYNKDDGVGALGLSALMSIVEERRFQLNLSQSELKDTMQSTEFHGLKVLSVISKHVRIL